MSSTNETSPRTIVDAIAVAFAAGGNAAEVLENATQSVRAQFLSAGNSTAAAVFSLWNRGVSYVSRIELLASLQ